MYSRSSRRSSLFSESTLSLDSMSSCSSISSLSSESSPAFEPPSPNGDPEIVRQGRIHIQPVGTFQTWSWHVKWLVLTDTSLTLHTSQNSPQKTVILLRDISVIAHTDFKPHCLLLETYNNRRLYLLFKNDEELQGWRDDLSARLPSMGYSTNNVPCTERRELMRDGEGIIISLEDYAQDPQAAIDVTSFSTPKDPVLRDPDTERAPVSSTTNPNARIFETRESAVRRRLPPILIPTPPHRTAAAPGRAVLPAVSERAPARSTTNPDEKIFAARGPPARRRLPPIVTPIPPRRSVAAPGPVLSTVSVRQPTRSTTNPDETIFAGRGPPAGPRLLPIVIPAPPHRTAAVPGPARRPLPLVIPPLTTTTIEFQKSLKHRSTRGTCCVLMDNARGIKLYTSEDSAPDVRARTNRTIANRASVLHRAHPAQNQCYASIQLRTLL